MFNVPFPFHCWQNVQARETDVVSVFKVREGLPLSLTLSKLLSSHSSPLFVAVTEAIDDVL